MTPFLWPPHSPSRRPSPVLFMLWGSRHKYTVSLTYKHSLLYMCTLPLPLAPCPPSPQPRPSSHSSEPVLTHPHSGKTHSKAQRIQRADSSSVSLLQQFVSDSFDSKIIADWLRWKMCCLNKKFQGENAWKFMTPSPATLLLLPEKELLQNYSSSSILSYSLQSYKYINSTNVVDEKKKSGLFFCLS